MDIVYYIIGLNVFVFLFLMLKDALFGPSEKKEYDSVLGGSDLIEDIVIYDQVFNKKH